MGNNLKYGELVEIRGNKGNKLNNYEIDITNHVDKDNLLYTYYDINIINKEDNTIFNLINIINVKNECFSINNGAKREYNNFTIGSLDTILYFLYTTYIYNTIYIFSSYILNINPIITIYKFWFKIIFTGNSF